MKRTLTGILCVIAVVALSAQSPSYHRPYTFTTASVDLGTTAVDTLSVAFKSLTIRSDPFNTGYICVGSSSSVTCQAAKASATTDGFKLGPGDSVTIQEVGWQSGTVYLVNTTANDWVSYIALN